MPLKIDNTLKLVADKHIGIRAALYEAKSICKLHNVKDCTLNYHGFIFDIHQHIDINAKIKEYRTAKRAKHRQ